MLMPPPRWERCDPANRKSRSGGISIQALSSEAVAQRQRRGRPVQLALDVRKADDLAGERVDVHFVDSALTGGLDVVGIHQLSLLDLELDGFDPSFGHPLLRRASAAIDS